MSSNVSATEAARQLEAFQSRATQNAEYPDEAGLKAFGALCFLAFRTKTMRDLPANAVRRLLQPPVNLGFFNIMQVDNVPRAAIVWAFLNADTERRLVEHGFLDPADWLSGDRMWIIQVLAPYGPQLGGHVSKWLRGLERAVPDEIPRIRFQRVDADGNAKHIAEAVRQPGKRTRVRLLAKTDLA